MIKQITMKRIDLVKIIGSYLFTLGFALGNELNNKKPNKEYELWIYKEKDKFLKSLNYIYLKNQK